MNATLDRTYPLIHIHLTGQTWADVSRVKAAAQARKLARDNGLGKVALLSSGGSSQTDKIQATYTYTYSNA